MSDTEAEIERLTKRARELRQGAPYGSRAYKIHDLNEAVRIEGKIANLKRLPADSKPAHETPKN